MAGRAVVIERGAFNRAHASQPGDNAPANVDMGMHDDEHLKRQPSLFRRCVLPPSKKSRPLVLSPSKKSRPLVPAAARAPSPEFGRDTAYVCDACCAVVWDPMLREHLPVWKYCPCCGSELMAQAQTSYSDAAQQVDATLGATIEGLGHARCEINAQRGSMAMEPRERSRRASAAPAGRPLGESAPVPSVRAPAGAREQATSSSHMVVLARRMLRTKSNKAPIAKRRTHRPPHTKTSAVDLLRRLKEQKLFGQSRFCDVCGYRNPQVKCRTCPSSFHRVCLGLLPGDAVPEDWSCHACKRREIERSKGDRDGDEALAIVDTARSKWKPPVSPMQCSSCGYHESESMNCDSCKRWFCFACMCLSAATLPINTWSCPECVGQDHYDEGRRKLIEASCRRVREERVTAKEQDGFSQLVFDLSCTCNWDEWERNIDTLIEHTRKQLKRGEIPVVMPFHSLHYSRPSTPSTQGMDKMMMRQISEAYAKHAKEEAYKAARVKLRDDGQGSEEFRAWKPERLKFSPNDMVCRLRIGYLSSDFVDHPTADLIQSALLKHDKSKFEIFCYSISREDDSDYRRRLSAEMEHFTHFSKNQNDKKCAEQIAADGIHILINLNGHTAGDRNGISALRPAPLQLVYLAYPGTMGADYIDYNVTDKTVCPDAHREFYTERMLYMPHCYQTNSFRELYSDILDTSNLPTRADHHLPAQPTFIFCNFCRLGRITPELFEVWMRILERVPDSVLWLYKHPKAAVWRLQSGAEKAGVDPERLIFGSPCSPKLEHLKRVTLADLALDTLVYNGHTTASDMLWAGVPLVTMRGDNWPSLVATCISEAAEMGEMVVADLQQYEEKAVQLATSPALLKKLKKKLAQKRKTAPLFDSDLWIRNFELSLDEVWRRYAVNEDAGDIVVKDIKPINTRRFPMRYDATYGSPGRLVRNGTCDGSTKSMQIAAAAEPCKENKGAKPRGESPTRKEIPRTAAAAGHRCQERWAENSEGDTPAQVRQQVPAAWSQKAHPMQQAAAREKRPREKMMPMLCGQTQQRRQQAEPRFEPRLGSIQRANNPPPTSQVHVKAESMVFEDSAQKNALESAEAAVVGHEAPRAKAPVTQLVPGDRANRLESWMSACVSTQKLATKQPGQRQPALVSCSPQNLSGSSNAAAALVPKEHSQCQGSEGQSADRRAGRHVNSMPQNNMSFGAASSADGVQCTDGANSLESGLHKRSPQVNNPKTSIPMKSQKSEHSSCVAFTGLSRAYSEEDMHRDSRPSNDLVHARNRSHLAYQSASRPVSVRYHSSSRDSISQSAMGHKSAMDLLLTTGMVDDDPLLALAQVAVTGHEIDEEQLAATPSQVQARFFSQLSHYSETQLPQYSKRNSPNPVHYLQQHLHQQHQHPSSLSPSMSSQQHMLGQGPAAAGSGFSLSTPQAEWAGRLADVVPAVSMGNPSFRPPGNGDPTSAQVIAPAVPVTPNSAANHQYPVFGFGTSNSQYLNPTKQWVNAPMGGGLAAIEGPAQLPREAVPVEALAPLPDSDNKNLYLERVKFLIKKTVRKVCNDEYKQHHQRGSANEAVKAHLKTVAVQAQTRLLKHLVRIPPGQRITDVSLEAIKQGYKQFNDQLALRCVQQASQSLVPQFYWLSGREF
jgi:predicted O-linked N-acetylglucosamine transferase (SPINDLY family)